MFGIFMASNIMPAIGVKCLWSAFVHASRRLMPYILQRKHCASSTHSTNGFQLPLTDVLITIEICA